MSGGDYQAAQWIPSPNFWPGGDGNWYVVIHATASGGPQTGYQLATSKEFTDGQSKSVHYINDVDGKVYQIVRESDSAWGNCCVDGNSPFDPNYNWNKKTISIENVKHSNDNSEPLTPVQYQSLLALVRDICIRQGIPMQQGTPTTKGIIYHHDLMPLQKARCPGNFPYATFFADLNQTGGLITLPDYPMVDQRNSRTYDGRYDENASMNCVPASFCSSIIYYARGTASNISADLLKDAVLGEAYLGGTSLRAFIPFVEQHYGVTATAWRNASNNALIAYAHREIKNGRPVIFTEVDPYVDTSQPEYKDWTHVCVFFGEAVGGLKAMDPWGGKVVTKSDAAWASVLRAGEIWVVTPKGQGLMGIPNGWTDVNGVLTAPNKQIVVQGFRNVVLAGWDTTNYPMGPERWKNPLEFSNIAIGEGAWQNFRYGALAYRKSTSQIYTPWIGQELEWHQQNYVTLMKERDVLIAQTAALQVQVAALQAQIAAGGGQIPAVVLDDIKAINAQIAPAMPLVNKLVKDAGL